MAFFLFYQRLIFSRQRPAFSQTISGRLVAPVDVFRWHECDLQFLSHHSGIDVAGRARRVLTPSASQLLPAYDLAQEGVDCPPSWTVLVWPFIITSIILDLTSRMIHCRL